MRRFIGAAIWSTLGVGLWLRVVIVGDGEKRSN